MTFAFDLKARTILLTLAGSRLYGIHTPTSDVDVKGVAVPTAPYYFGFAQRFEQADAPEHIALFHDRLTEEEQRICRTEKLEGTIFGIHKLFQLSSQLNPNCFDLIFAEDKHVRQENECGRLIRENRELFISTKVRQTFGGYSRAQFARIRTHRRWLLAPVEHQPTREEYGLPNRTLIPDDQLEAAFAAIRKKQDEWELDLSTIESEADRLSVIERISSMLEEIIGADSKFNRAGRAIGLDDNFLLLMDRERRFKAAQNEWAQYQHWKKTRNPARAALEAQFGMDCYTDDTEFLTETGWKKFDDVTEQDKLATMYVGETTTVRGYGEVEYQKYTEKFSGVFTGNLYHFSGQHTDILVTPNHRMYARHIGRNTGNKYPWKFYQACQLPKSFDLVASVTPKTRNHKDEFVDVPLRKEAYLSLMGWYLSDGCLNLRENGEPKELRISQIKDGKLYQKMYAFQRAHSDFSKIYEYVRQPNEYNPNVHVETVLTVNDSRVLSSIYDGCGHVKNKRIPRWVFNLGRHQMETLIENMILGDGTIRNTNLRSYVYYSSLERLADDIQELAFLCGWETAKWGPYTKTDSTGRVVDMWQVHLNKNKDALKQIVARASTVAKVPTENRRVVCFSVPNEMLITRRNGKIAIQGNSKHASHLVRLCRMCKEILHTGKVNIDRTGIDAEELLAIRNGAWSYEQLEEWFEREDKAITEFYNSGKSPLPKSADVKQLDLLCQQIVARELARPGP